MIRLGEIAKVTLGTGQLWRPDNGTADRRITRIEAATSGMLAGSTLVWFREDDAAERPQQERSFRNWMGRNGTHLVGEPAIDPDALPIKD